MNYVAGLLLLVMNGEEEQTFWLFDAMVTLLPPCQYVNVTLRVAMLISARVPLSAYLCEG